MRLVVNRNALVVYLSHVDYIFNIVLLAISSFIETL